MIPDETAIPAIAALKSCFTIYEPPLVLKSDNGPAFTSAALGQMLAEQGITRVSSLAPMPWYNDGCRMGSMRIRTDHFTQCTGGWTSTALHAAHCQ